MNNEQIKKERLAQYIIAVITTIHAMNKKNAITNEEVDIIHEVTASLCETYDITLEMLDNIKTDMDFETTFNQK